VTETNSNLVVRTPRDIARRLGSIRGVRREMARLYADARGGDLEPSVAAKLSYVLCCIQKSLEAEVIEQRLAALEAAAERKP
jgi:hypothetical protein